MLVPINKDRRYYIITSIRQDFQWYTNDFTIICLVFLEHLERFLAMWCVIILIERIARCYFYNVYHIIWHKGKSIWINTPWYFSLTFSVIFNGESSGNLISSLYYILTINDRIISLRGCLGLWSQFTPTVVIEVSVPSLESERSCVSGVSIFIKPFFD
jgi:hypothetical protein